MAVRRVGCVKIQGFLLLKYLISPCSNLLLLTQTRCWRSLDRKLISVDTLMSGDAKWRELKIAADGDNTWQIGQIKVASYFQNRQQKETIS